MNTIAGKEPTNWNPEDLPRNRRPAERIWKVRCGLGQHVPIDQVVLIKTEPGDESCAILSSTSHSAGREILMGIRALLATVTVSLFTTACTSDAQLGNMATKTDSAGVVVVENTGPAPADGGGWSVGTEPILTIGTVEGEEAYQFFDVAGVHRFRDGRIGVVNSSSQEVRVFAADGTFLRSFGQRGAGPEEFEMPVMAGSMGDTLIVVDRAHHRLTFVHPDQGFVGLARVSDDVGGYLNPSGSFADGRSVYGGAFDMRRIGELHNGMNRAGTFYRSANPDGSLAADFGDKDGAEFFIKDMEGSGQESRPALIPFAKVSMATVSPSYFFFSDQDNYEIEVYDSSGAMVRLIRLDWEPVSVTPTDGARHIESVVEQAGTPDEEAEIRAYFGALPLAETFPPHGPLLADRLDCLWVEDFQRPGFENRAWNVFNETGVLTGRVTLPERFNPIEIGDDYVLGVGWDDMNVEFVKMFALTRTSGPR
jgi:hypothetical protein